MGDFTVQRGEFHLVFLHPFLVGFEGELDGLEMLVASYFNIFSKDFVLTFINGEGGFFACKVGG